MSWTVPRGSFLAPALDAVPTYAWGISLHAENLAPSGRLGVAEERTCYMRQNLETCGLLCGEQLSAEVKGIYASFVITEECRMPLCSTLIPPHEQLVLESWQALSKCRKATPAHAPIPAAHLCAFLQEISPSRFAMRFAADSI